MAKQPIEVKALKHRQAKRRNIPTAEFESVMEPADKAPVRMAIERRNRDLDPQLVWRGKDAEELADPASTAGASLVVHAPPLFIQEKVHAKALIDDLQRQAKERARERTPAPDLFADFNGLPDEEAKTEFYRHDANWSNRLILGDSLAVMASLAEREGLRGQVQAIYIDPPYGIRFNSNFQWSTTSRDVKDGNLDHLTREPEQVKAFRDTWRDGIHSYLTYLRDRLTVARELLTESGSCFVQIGDENVHRVRALMDEVFREENFVALVGILKTSGLQSGSSLPQVLDYVLQYARDKERVKFRPIYVDKREDTDAATEYFYIELDDGSSRTMSKDEKDGAATPPEGSRPFSLSDLTKPGPGRKYDFAYSGATYSSKSRWWGNPPESLRRLGVAGRLHSRQNDVRFRRFLDDFPIRPIANFWQDTAFSSRAEDKVYVVQSSYRVIQRCLLMTTDPGELVLDPTCGSGTTAFVAEAWGRRWITIDTSRVALALARARIMGAKFPYYLLADSPEGRRKEAEVTRTPAPETPSHNDIRQGFVYERCPYITSGRIANNIEIDVIWEARQPAVEAARNQLNAALAGHATPFKVETGGRAGQSLDFRRTGEVTLPSGEPAPAGGLMEWEVPREDPPDWPEAARVALSRFWEARIARQKEVDASIDARAEFEYLYDKPYEDRKRIRVAGPFTVESLSPHRMLAVDLNDELIDILKASEGKRLAPDRDEVAGEFAQMILENLKVAGVQQAYKEDRIAFTSLVGWPGRFICAEGRFLGDPLGDLRVESKHDGHEGGTKATREMRAGIFIGPEFGTVSRPDLVAAAREAGDAGFDLLIACAFNYDAHSAEFDRLGRVPVLKARMNPDLHMGGDLKATASGNLFVIFGEPDIKIEDMGDGMIRVKVFGVDVFKPQTGEVISEGTDGIALWMLDTDYNEESFFVRHAYFLGANDPYKALKTTLKAEIDEEAWESLHSDTSRPFPKPASGRIAVKVINHLGDEVMKVFAA